jgi:hypothetical protein
MIISEIEAYRGYLRSQLLGPLHMATILMKRLMTYRVLLRPQVALVLSQSIYLEIGLFQWFSTASLIAGLCSGSFIAYAISFLELNPRYLCMNPVTHKEYECTRDVICDKAHSVQWRIDWDDPTSLHNWIEDLDLTCTPKELIGLIGSMFFAGWAFGATFLPRLADVFGRKKVYIGAMTGHAIFFFAIVLSRNRILTTVLMFFLGVMSVGRASVGYLYMIELSPLKQ